MGPVLHRKDGRPHNRRCPSTAIQHCQRQLLTLFFAIWRCMLQDMLHRAHPIQLLLCINRSIAQVKYVLWNCNPLGLCLLDATCKLLLPFEHAAGRIDITPFSAMCSRQPQSRTQVTFGPLLPTARRTNVLRVCRGTLLLNGSGYWGGLLRRGCQRCSWHDRGGQSRCILRLRLHGCCRRGENSCTVVRQCSCCGWQCRWGLWRGHRRLLRDKLHRGLLRLHLRLHLLLRCCWPSQQ